MYRRRKGPQEPRSPEYCSGIGMNGSQGASIVWVGEAAGGPEAEVEGGNVEEGRKWVN